MMGSVGVCTVYFESLVMWLFETVIAGEELTMAVQGNLRGSEVWSLESLIGRVSRAERNERANDISVILVGIWQK
jgi:hypothetical protein